MQSTAVVIYESKLSVFAFVIMMVIRNLGEQKFSSISIDRTFYFIDHHY